jgi:hypothetical protein
MSNTNEDKSTPEEPKKRGRGRPRKTDILSKKEGGRKTMGRPKGDATIINEYKARMLASPKSRKVLDTIFEAALDNEHKNQSAAWKLVMDRIAPVAAFEKDIIKNGGGNAISINITGVGSGGVKVGNDVVDGEYKELDNE